ncbi:MAG: hypothetical protein Kow0037_32540 [Calditrichia bacterium]
MKKIIIIIIFFIINFIPLRAQDNISNLLNSRDSTNFKIIKLNFKVGINSNFLQYSKDFKSNFTGWGVVLEPQLTSRFSVIFSLNSLNIKTKTDKNHLIEFSKLKSKESNIKLRYRFINSTFSLYPEIGIGNWGRDLGLFMVGAGSEYQIYHNFFANLNFNYSTVFYRYLDVGGNGWKSDYLKIAFELKYFISLKMKGKPINHQTHIF